MYITSLENLKEHKQHGDSMLPIALYPVSHKAAGSILSHHWHNEFEFIFFSAGRAVFAINEEEITAQAGDCIFVNSGQIHSGFSRTGDTSYFSVVFSPELLVGSFDSCRKYFDSILSGEYKLTAHFSPEIPVHGEVISELKAIIKELTDKNTAYELALKSRLFSLFSTLFRNNLYTPAPATKKNSLQTKKHYLIKNILGYISQNNHRKISLGEISEFVNLTPQYLCRFFKEMTGHNIVDYINRYRIEKASTLLKVSNLNITDIALDCGFDNISYFNRVFKKQNDCTPTEFRSNK